MEVELVIGGDDEAEETDTAAGSLHIRRIISLIAGKFMPPNAVSDVDTLTYVSCSTTPWPQTTSSLAAQRRNQSEVVE
jgi:hypothetical protein